VRSVFGDEMFESFVTEKRAEWNGYNAHVSAWESERYLRFW
jgi:glutamine synthetase